MGGRCLPRARHISDIQYIYLAVTLYVLVRGQPQSVFHVSTNVLLIKCFYLNLFCTTFKCIQQINSCLVSLMNRKLIKYLFN